MQKQKLRAEAGPERSGERVVTWFQGPLFQPFLKDKEDRSARQVAYIAQDIPGRLGLALGKAESDFDISEEARSTGVENPAFDILKFLAVALEKSVNQFADFFADHFRDVLGEQDVKAGIAKVETHRAKGIGKSVRLRDHDLGTANLPAGDQHGRSPAR